MSRLELAPKPVVGSDAFRLEYHSTVNPHSLRDDIRSYLGEYRVQLPVYNYTLLYSYYPGEGKHIRDPHTQESMTYKAQRAIRLKQLQRKSASREIAELSGILSLEQQLALSENGSFVVWASPPGPRSEGYGDYGFLFIGTREAQTLKMQAFRLENIPSIEQYNESMRLLTGKPFRFHSAEQFLASPVVIERFSADPAAVLADIFGFTVDHERLQTFKNLMQKMNPYIDQFIDLVQKGTSSDKLIAAFYAIENFTLLMKDSSLREDVRQFALPRFDELIHHLGFAPPAAAGSCGNTQSSNNLFSDRSSLKSILSSTDYKNDPNLCRCGNIGPHFHCPGKTKDGGACNHPIIVGQGTTVCPNCGTGKMC